MKKLRIVFMGTPGFASGILKGIKEAGHEIAGVVTVADKPSGRGQKVNVSAVKQYAEENGLFLMQPEKLKDPEFLETLRSLQADVFVIVAFRMLPREVWQMPPLGTFNLHASLLPQYRGAAPINWALINGEKATGVTTFFIDDKIDTGATLLRSEITIGPDENAGMLHDRLMEIGAATVLDTLNGLAEGNLTAVPQPDSGDLKAAPKLDRENTRIDWNKDAKKVHDLIRGLSPYPSAWTTIKNGSEDLSVKIYGSEIVEGLSAGKPGTIRVDGRKIRVSTADGEIGITELQFPGKKKMTASDLLNGFTFPEGAIFV